MPLLLLLMSMVLLGGCSGPCGPAERQDLELSVTAEQFAEAVDPQGELTPKACVDLCIELYCGDIEEVHGCALVEPPSTTGTQSGATIACDVAAVPCCE